MSATYDAEQEILDLEHAVSCLHEEVDNERGQVEYWNAIAVSYWEEVKLLRAEVERLGRVFSCQADEHRWYAHWSYGQVCQDCGVLADTLEPEPTPELDSWSLRREWSYARGWEGRGVLDAAWTAWSRWLA